MEDKVDANMNEMDDAGSVTTDKAGNTEVLVGEHR